jgi:hypothetical protein
MRRVKRRQHRSQYDAAHVHTLLTGHDYFHQGSDWCEDAWAEMGNHLLAEYIAIYPGYRPHAWWKYSDPEPRQQLSGPPLVWPEHIDQHEYFFGVPACHPPLAWSEPFQEFESTAAYLSRLGLLLDCEQKVELDYQPVFYPAERGLDVVAIADSVFPENH